MAADRVPLAYQFEELELSYLERRERLQEDERRGRVTTEARSHRNARLLRLRAARETLYRMALADPESGGLARTITDLHCPQDLEGAA